MPRRTDLERLTDVIDQLPGQQATPRRLAEMLGWDLDKVARVAAKGDGDPMVPIFIARGGVIKHRGREVGAVAGIYADVMRVIRDYWGPRVLGLRNIEPIMTARAGTRSDGVWSHPDLVVVADPARRDSMDEPRRLHAVEVETIEGFDLRSVYQAHAQGRGANYSWVFGNKAPGVDPADWERIRWTVRELGIGLVTFAQPDAFGTWTMDHKAVRKFPTPVERDAFIDRTMSVSDRNTCGI